MAEIKHSHRQSGDGSDASRGRGDRRSVREMPNAAAGLIVRRYQTCPVSWHEAFRDARDRTALRAATVRERNPPIFFTDEYHLAVQNRGRGSLKWPVPD